jgi:hypothetical protein
MPKNTQKPPSVGNGSAPKFRTMLTDMDAALKYGEGRAKRAIKRYRKARQRSR